MFFSRKKPKRLYIPTRSRWYLRPRRRSAAAPAYRLRNHWAEWAKKWLKNRIAVMGAGVFIAAFIGVFISSSYLAIATIQVLREDFNIDSAAIENELNPYLGKNMLLVPKYRLIRAIHDKFPEFRSVTIQKVFPGTLKISLESHDIVANLRAYYILPEPEEKIDESSALDQAIAELELEPENTDTLAQAPPPIEDENVRIEAFSLDAAARKKEREPKPIEQKALLNYNGQAIFDREQDLELMTIYIPGLTQPVEDRQQVIPLEHMDYIRSALQHFNSGFTMEVEGLEYRPGAREIRIGTKKGPTIWLAIEKDYKDQLEKLQTIYEPAELNKEDIAYIDLRVREKVIYCPRSASCSH